MKEKRVPRAQYERFFCFAGLFFLIFGVLLKLGQSAPFFFSFGEAFNLRRIYDLPVFLMLIGATVSLKGLITSMKPRHGLSEK